MGILIISPPNSFVQFNESEQITDCIWPEQTEVLICVEDNDWNFQWILQTDTKAEADALCADMGANVKCGIALNCGSDNLITFTDAPERFRLDDTHVLYNWIYGFPLFGSVIPDAGCFLFTVDVTASSIKFCSSIFKRFLNGCFTSVLDYTNDDNFAGFNYCGGSVVQETADCTPLEITFSNQTTLTIPYTAALIAKYGIVPTVQVWILDTITGTLVDMGIRVSFDAFPPTEIFVDLGGPASGVLKIM